MTLVATRLDKLRAIVNADKNERRVSRYGVLNMFATQTDSPLSFITEEMKQKAWESVGRGLAVPVIDHNSGLQIKNVANLVIAPVDNTSKMMEVTFKRYAFEFTTEPALHMNNSIDVQRDFNAKMLGFIIKLGKQLEEDLVVALEANKTQVIAKPLHYAVAGNTIEALWKWRKDVLGDLDPIMHANDYFKGLDIVGNAGLQSLLGSLEELGMYKSENKAGQYANKRVHLSERVENADATDYGTGFAVEDGNLGLLFRVERDAQMFSKGHKHQWGQTTLPILGLPCGTFYYNDGVDLSEKEADMTRTLRDHFGFCFDMAIVTPYNSDPATNATPILKYTIKRESEKDAIMVKQLP